MVCVCLCDGSSSGRLSLLSNSIQRLLNIMIDSHYAATYCSSPIYQALSNNWSIRFNTGIKTAIISRMCFECAFKLIWYYLLGELSHPSGGRRFGALAFRSSLFAPSRDSANDNQSPAAHFSDVQLNILLSYPTICYYCCFKRSFVIYN